MSNNKKTLKNIGAIFFGFFLAFAVIGIFMVIAAFIDLSGNALLDLILLAVPCIAGGFATSSSAANYKILCTLILSILISSLLAMWFKFNLTDNNYPKNYSEIIKIVIFCLVGGLIGRNRKL
jgi:hypothetical protein